MELAGAHRMRAISSENNGQSREKDLQVSEIYFSADVETDGPIPGPFSMLSFALVYAGSFDGQNFVRPDAYENVFYRELQPISENFQQEALDVNKLDREKLSKTGHDPRSAMNDAADWIKKVAGDSRPILVAYPVSFDWTWLYWYFTAFCELPSPFGHSNCFDVKTALAVKNNGSVASSSRSKLPAHLRSNRPHTHFAVDDAIEQAEVFANIFEWQGCFERTRKKA